MRTQENYSKTLSRTAPTRSSGIVHSGPKLVHRIIADRSVRAAIFPFVLTRSIIFVICILAMNLAVGEPKRIGEFQAPSISLHRAPISLQIRALTQRGDSGWYLEIARHGYEHQPFSTQQQHTWAFFPLYPLLLRFAAKITGGYQLTGILLSHFLFLPALVFLHKLALEWGMDETAAERTIFYLAIFPTSYFFSLPVSESLFLLLTLGSFYEAARDRWAAAGLIGGLASASRAAGVLLLPALLVLYWQKHHRIKPNAKLLGLSFIPAGLLVFMFHLHRITGNAFAFKDALASWNRKSSFLLAPLWGFLMKPYEISYAWDFRLLNFAAGGTALVCVIVLLHRRQWALAVYTFLCAAMALSSGLLQSLARYVMTVFPVFMVLAWAGRYPLIDQVIRAAFLVLLGLMTALYAAHFALAMA